MHDSYAVNVDDVSKSFGAIKALNGVTLRVRQGEIYGLLGPNGAEDVVKEALELVQLYDRRASVVATLSGGMRQRCSLACALVHRPELLLLDEPTVGIDPQLRVQFWEYFRRMAAAGTTLIVSSHVMDEADRCQRLGLIQYGRLLAEGSPADIRVQGGSQNLEEAFLALAGRRES